MIKICTFTVMLGVSMFAICYRVSSLVKTLLSVRVSGLIASRDSRGTGHGASDSKTFPRSDRNKLVHLLPSILGVPFGESPIRKSLGAEGVVSCQSKARACVIGLHLTHLKPP